MKEFELGYNELQYVAPAYTNCISKYRLGQI